MSSSVTAPESRPRSFLVVCFRFIGDVLVTLPLAVSIKQAIPDASVDYLVFEGTEGVLAHNPLIRRVITVSKNRSNAGILMSLFRRYDVAFAAYPSDRTLVATALAGKQSIALIYGDPIMWWKKLLITSLHICDDRFHVVANMLALLRPLGIPPVPRVSVGFDDSDLAFARHAMPADKYVILHPYSRNPCKYWPAEEWGKLVALIQDQTDCRAVITKTPAPEDIDYLERILSTAPADTVVFKEPMTLSQMAAAIKGCTAFIGIDTAVTHIAAALDIPTICLFGPSMSRYWGPWPNGCQQEAPFDANKGIQRVGNVTIVQKDWECVPCNRETCAISSRDRMECLEATTPEEVLNELLESVGGSRVGQAGTCPQHYQDIQGQVLQEGAVAESRRCGGLRAQGIYKQSLPQTPLLSVILPVYNGGAKLAEAIGSVARQHYPNIELIIIDGASTDNTLDIISDNEELVDLWISEADNGVYDAMNKGADLANGDWLYFLGSDDVLLDVVHEVMPLLKDPHGIYYGEVRRTSGKKGIGLFSGRQLIRRNIPHQAIIYPRSVFGSYCYDVKYPVAADYHLNLRCFGDPSFHFVHLPFVIALFNDAEGLSSTRNDPAFAADKPRLVREYLGFFLFLELEIRSGLTWFEKNVFRTGYRRLTGRSQAKRTPAGEGR